MPKKALRGYYEAAWPQLSGVVVRYRSGFAHVAGESKGGEVFPLCRLRFTGVLHTWGFARYLASRDCYQDSILPSGLPTGSPEQALDCACDLHFNAAAPTGSGPTGVPTGLIGPSARRPRARPVLFGH